MSDGMREGQDTRRPVGAGRTAGTSRLRRLTISIGLSVLVTGIHAQAVLPAAGSVAMPMAPAAPRVTDAPRPAFAPALPPPAAASMPKLTALDSEADGRARPAGVSLVEFLAMVRRESPALLADRSLVDMARADLRTAATLPNPAVSYSRGAGDRQVSVQQPLPIFGQRGLRMEGARKAIDSASANVDALAADALRSAAETFATLLAAQERTRRWSEAREALAEAAAIVEGQVAAGARSRYDLARIRVEAAQLAMREEQAEATEANTAAQLAAAVGATGWRPRAIGSPRPAVGTGDFAGRWERARAQLPAVRAAVASEALAETLIAVERREAWPTPSVGVGHLRDGDGRHMLLGVSVEIPLFDRREGPIARARAVADESRQRRRAVLLAAEAELGRTVDQFQHAQRISERFEADTLTALSELERMARDAYRLGRGGILELIDALLAGAEKRIAHIELVEAMLKAEVAVHVASGELGVEPY